MISPDKIKILGFLHGIDPATKGDYYTDVVHMLPEKPALRLAKGTHPYQWKPYLVDILRLKKRPPMEMVDLQVQQFNKFPPLIATIDTTREDFLSSAFVRRYGESRILPMHFGNVGQLNTKFSLKQIGYAYIQAGYEWPDPSKIEKRMPKFAKLLRILKKEMMREIVTFTKNDRVTSDHPIGKHNDLVHGWEMSLHSVMKAQERNLGMAKNKIESQPYKNIIEKIYENYPTESEDPYDTEVYNRGMGNSAFSLK